VTTHYILKELKDKNIARVITKNNVKYFSVISASELIKREEEKINKLKSILPELTLL
jgi:sugar-specific transcriptional regulator TrmB